MKRFFAHPAVAILLVVGATGYATAEYPAHVELDAMEEPTVTMTRAELAAHDAEIRIEAAREAFSAKQCSWRDTFVQPRKKT